MDFDVITASLKKAYDGFMANAVAYIIGFIIGCLGSCLIVTAGPFTYGLYYMVLKGTRGETVEYKDVFYGFSGGRFVRSWIGFIGLILPFLVVALAAFIISSLLTMVLKTAGVVLGLLVAIIAAIVCFILAIFLCYTLLIYVMTPSENIVFALKESFRIGKANIVMTLLTLIVSGVCGIIPIVGAIIGQLFFVYMLKEIEPSLKDQS